MNKTQLRILVPMLVRTSPPTSSSFKSSCSSWLFGELTSRPVPSRQDEALTNRSASAVPSFTTSCMMVVAVIPGFATVCSNTAFVQTSEKEKQPLSITLTWFLSLWWPPSFLSFLTFVCSFSLFVPKNLYDNEII